MGRVDCRMDARTFLGLESTHNDRRWHMPVHQRNTTSGGFLFGGCALGAAISAMEGTTNRPCVWATAQYLSYARPGEVLDIDVIIANEGNSITQARVVGHVGEREILTVNAALGERTFDHNGQFVEMPTVPHPDTLPQREHMNVLTGSFHDYLEERFAKGRTLDQLDGTANDGRTQMWARIPSVIDAVDAATLAILGDFVPMGVGQAFGIRGGGNSLDNTLRVVKLVSTNWILLDIQIHGVQNGFGHGEVHMWAEDGTLLAVASQSCIARMWRDEPLRRGTKKETT